MKTESERKSRFNFILKRKLNVPFDPRIQSKNLLNMKIVDNYFNFVFHIEVKMKSNYEILNFKNTKCHFGYTDFRKMKQVSICKRSLLDFILHMFVSLALSKKL